MASALMNEMVKRGHSISLMTLDPENAQSFYPLDSLIVWHKVAIGDPLRRATLRDDPEGFKSSNDRWISQTRHHDRVSGRALSQHPGLYSGDGVSDYSGGKECAHALRSHPVGQISAVDLSNLPVCAAYHRPVRELPGALSGLSACENCNDPQSGFPAAPENLGQVKNGEFCFRSVGWNTRRIIPFLSKRLR